MKEAARLYAFEAQFSSIEVITPDVKRVVEVRTKVFMEKSSCFGQSAVVRSWTRCAQLVVVPQATL